MYRIRNFIYAAVIASMASIVAKEADVEKQIETKTLVFETTQGNFTVTLFPQVAPKACENFVKLAKKGYYDGLIFHRVIKDFMIQGGDPTGTGRGGESIYGRTFEDEFSNDVDFSSKGILAMANAGPNTNGSQFFITTAATPWLNQRHTIFGRVSEGYEVIDKIQNVATGAQDKPVEKQVIKKIILK